MASRHIKIKTGHGTLTTPFFMPDATRAVVKGVSGNDLKNVGVEALVVNTYHLYLEPGLPIIQKAGGSHKFMAWDKPLLSDSGGFQVFSLIHKNRNMGRVTDSGAKFKSPYDGSWHELTPEKSIQIQFTLGTDMMVALDDCPPNSASREVIQKAVERTISWAERSKIAYEKEVQKRGLTKANHPLLFGVIQGGSYLDLREHCARELVKIGFDGYGFGAMPINEAGVFDYKLLKAVVNFIPEKSLRFALGIGRPEDIIKCYQAGWDMFDCVIPTREGRHGKLFQMVTGKQQTEDNKQVKFKIRSLNINNAKFKRDFKAINPDSRIKELQEHSRAYLHHLFKINDLLAARLASLNNLEVYAELMRKF